MIETWRDGGWGRGGSRGEAVEDGDDEDDYDDVTWCVEHEVEYLGPF